MRPYFIIAFCLFVSQLFGQANNSGEFIAVIGEASGSFVPDMITFHFTVDVTEKKQAEAVEKLNEQATLFIEKVINLGVNPEKIKLSKYSLSEAFDYSGDKMKNIGYEATEIFELEVKYSDKDFNMFIDSISGTKFPNLSFTYQMTFSDSLKNEIKNNLISKASDDAMQIAKTLARSRNLVLGDIFSIEYTSNISSLYGEESIPPPPPPPSMIYAASSRPPEIRSRVSQKGIETTQQLRIVFKIDKNAR
jgi:uncharacterized protein YggE